MASTLEPPNQLTRWVRAVARVLALVGVGPMLLGLWYQQAWTGEALLLLVLTAVSLCAVVLAWRAEGIGGALMAMSGLAVGLVTCMDLEQLRLDVLLGMGGCEMVAGALLMACWFREARRAVEVSPRAPRATTLHAPVLLFLRP